MTGATRGNGCPKGDDEMKEVVFIDGRRAALVSFGVFRQQVLVVEQAAVVLREMLTAAGFHP
jgi:hypothetical protein